MKKKDINQAYQDFLKEDGGLLIDVRDWSSYKEGHLPGASHLAFEDIEGIEDQAPDKDQPIYLYCRSGRKSGLAQALLEDWGYTQVQDIGGILDFRGDLEEGAGRA